MATPSRAAVRDFGENGCRHTVQSILDDGPPLRHELHLPALLPQPVLKATSSTIVTRSYSPDLINAGRSLT